MRRLLFVTALLLALLTVAPTAASAAADNWGPWYPEPGTAGQGSEVYRPDYTPASSARVSEAVNFVCTGPNGYALSGRDRDTLSTIFRDATAAYYGKLETENPTDVDPIFGIQFKDLVPWFNNGGSTGGDGGRGGAEGMQRFLRYQVALLKSGYWASFGQANGDKLDNDNPDDIGSGGDPASRQAVVDRYAAGGISGGQRIAVMVNMQATGPIDLNAKLDEGCGINPVDVEKIAFGTLLSDPGEFATDLIFYIPAKVTSGLYGLVKPWGFKYSFYTPHTERGDTYFNTQMTCDLTERKKDAARFQDSCRAAGTGGAGQPRYEALGFSRSRLDVRNNDSWYLQTANYMQWLVSGTYFLIFFASAVIFMVRGSANNKFNVLQVVPRLAIAAVLTVFAPWLIGFAITVSNTFVQTLFQMDDFRTVGAIDQVIAQANFVTGAGDFVGRLMNIIMGFVGTWYFAFFAIMALIRQVLLIACIILAPVAMLCFVVPKWQHHFWRWVKAILVICFTPALMAGILKVGMALNPILLTSAGATGGLGFLGLLMLIATFWLMGKAMRASFAAATGARLPSMSTKMLMGAGQTLQLAGMTGVIPGGPAAGTAVLGAARAKGKADGALIPQGRELGVGGSGRGGMGGIGRSMGGAMSGGMAMGGRALGTGMGGPMGGAAGGVLGSMVGEKLQERMMLRQADRGEQVMYGRRAMQIRSARTRALRDAEAQNGKMTRSERKEFLDGWDDQHGRLKRRGGQWVLQQSDAAKDPSDERAVDRRERAAGHRLSDKQKQAVVEQRRRERADGDDGRAEQAQRDIAETARVVASGSRQPTKLQDVTSRPLVRRRRAVTGDLPSPERGDVAEHLRAQRQQQERRDSEIVDRVAKVAQTPPAPSPMRELADSYREEAAQPRPRPEQVDAQPGAVVNRTEQIAADEHQREKSHQQMLDELHRVDARRSPQPAAKQPERTPPVA